VNRRGFAFHQLKGKRVVKWKGRKKAKDKRGAHEDAGRIKEQRNGEGRAWANEPRRVSRRSGQKFCPMVGRVEREEIKKYSEKEGEPIHYWKGTTKERYTRNQFNR